MYAVKAIYDGENFKPLQPIPVSGQHEVVITFLRPLIGEWSDMSSVLDDPYESLDFSQNKCINCHSEVSHA